MSQKTILLVDDEPPVREFVVAVLKKGNYHILTAVDANDALAKSSSHHGRIDLLLSDVEMPGMTGVELATQLRLQRPDMKILLISGFEAGMLVLDEGWQFLPKPFVPNMLREKIRLMLDEEQAGRASGAP